MGNTGGKQDLGHVHDEPRWGKLDQARRSSSDEGPPEDAHDNHLESISSPEKKSKKKGCYGKECLKNACLKIFFVVVGALTILTAIAEIAATVTTAIATKIYSSELSGRHVAMTGLAVMAAIALSSAIYSITSVLRGKKKGLHATMIALIILAVLQAVIAGVAVRVTSADEVELGRSLSDSFKLARDDIPRYIKIWDTTQHELSCCGVYSAEDYRRSMVPLYFPPDVPIACCPGYDPHRSDLAQEREREKCKARKEFYDVGCMNLVLEVFKDTSVTVLCVTVALIILEIKLAVASYLLSRSKGKLNKKDEQNLDTLEQAERGRRSAEKSKNKDKPQNLKDAPQNHKDLPQSNKSAQKDHKVAQKDHKPSGKAQEA